MGRATSNPKKSLGQYWLNDEAALRAMCAAADISAVDTVLEIGPGQGSLTKILAGQARLVIAVELDARLVTELAQSISAGNVQIVQGDILKFNFTPLPYGYKIVANIPYYLTSNLIRVLSESTNPPVVAALLVQKEVAERVNAQPGKMSILSVTAQYYWQVSLGRVVKAGLFTPSPKVDSQILILQRRARPLFEVDSKIFFRLVKAGFSQKRKTLENSLSAGLAISKTETKKLLENASFQPSCRAQTLSLGDWHKLYGVYCANG